MIDLYYGITVSVEDIEIINLIKFIRENSEDNILIQYDTTKCSKELLNKLKSFDVKITGVPFNGDFSEFKNKLNEECFNLGADYIFQLDADEMISLFLIRNIKEILINNPEIELFYVPRINTVDGITEEHIRRWNWKFENNRINYPDYQSRLYKSYLKWGNKVHERIVDAKRYGILPAEDDYCIIHNKTIEKQEKQNSFYNTL